MSINLSNILNVSFQSRSFSNGNGQSVTRSKLDISGSGDNSAQAFKTTLGNGDVFTRQQVKSVNDDGSVSIQGNVSGPRGQATFTGNVAADKQSAEITFTGPNGGTKTVDFNRVHTGPIPGPRPGPIPVDQPPVHGSPVDIVV